MAFPGLRRPCILFRTTLIFSWWALIWYPLWRNLGCQVVPISYFYKSFRLGASNLNQYWFSLKKLFNLQYVKQLRFRGSFNSNLLAEIWNWLWFFCFKVNISGFFVGNILRKISYRNKTWLKHLDITMLIVIRQSFTTLVTGDASVEWRTY